MYLTGGQYKGHKINIPKDARPTLSKVRESIFNILFQYETKNNKFLDMFGGSGIMGLEAISRGFDVKVLEINPKNAKTIKENYKKLKLNADIVICDSLKYKNEQFSVIYIDPPWDYDYNKIIIKAFELLDADGLIVIEHDTNISLDLNDIISQNALDLQIIKSKKYGRCLIDILR